MGSAFLFYFVTMPTSLTYRAIYLPRKLQLSSALPTSIRVGIRILEEPGRYVSSYDCGMEQVS